MVLINPKWLALTEINTQQCYVVVWIPYKMVALAAQAQAFEKNPPKPLAPPCNWGSTIHTLVPTWSIELSSIKVPLWNTCTEKIYRKSGTAKAKRTSPESCADGCDLRHKTLYKKHIFNTTFKIIKILTKQGRQRQETKSVSTRYQYVCSSWSTSFLELIRHKQFNVKVLLAACRSVLRVSY